MRHRSSCNSELRVTHGLGVVLLEQSVPHTTDSHEEHTPHRLRPEVQEKVRQTVETDFSMSATKVRRVARTESSVDLSQTYKIRRLVTESRGKNMKAAAIVVTLSHLCEECFENSVRKSPTNEK
jgi:hypothetical protein